MKKVMQTLENEIKKTKERIIKFGEEEAEIRQRNHQGEDLRKYVEKYLKKIVVWKIKFSTYRLEYHFLDGRKMVYHFYSTCKWIKLYDKDMKEIAQEEVKKRG